MFQDGFFNHQPVIHPAESEMAIPKSLWETDEFIHLKSPGSLQHSAGMILSN